MLRFAYHSRSAGLYVADFNGIDWKVSLVDACRNRHCEIYTVGNRMFVCDPYISAANNTYCSTNELLPSMGLISVNYTPKTRHDRTGQPIVDGNGIVYSYEHDSILDGLRIFSSVTLRSRDKNYFKIWKLPMLSTDIRVNNPIFVDDHVYLVASCADHSLCEMVSIIQVSRERFATHGCAVSAIDRTMMVYDAYAGMVHMRDLRMKDPFSCEVAPCVPYKGYAGYELMTSTVLQTNAIATAHEDGVRVIDMRSPAYAYDLPLVPGYDVENNSYAKFVVY